MKTLLLILLVGCGSTVRPMDTPDDGGIPDADIPDVQLSEIADTLPRITDAIAPLPDVGSDDAGPPDAGPPPVDAGPPVPLIASCQRLRLVWYNYMLDTFPQCEHTCPWVDHPGPCDAAAVLRCENAITVPAMTHDCAGYEAAMAACDTTACGAL